MKERLFLRTIGVDYSGADTPLKRLKGLAVYCADGDGPPYRLRAPNGLKRGWTRKKLAECLVEILNEKDKQTLVGIDHAFSFPIRYFQKYEKLLGPRWDDFLNDFQKHWPTDDDEKWVEPLKSGTGKNRCGDPKWRRLTDKLAVGAQSPFNFGGRVAHSTHAGLPWLRYIRRELGDKVHFWPFDGWNCWEGKSVIVEVYPTLWNRRFKRLPDMSEHDLDAYSVAWSVSHLDQNGLLDEYFRPELSPEEKDRAKKEGWILGVPGFTPTVVGKDRQAA